MFSAKRWKVPFGAAGLTGAFAASAVLASACISPPTPMHYACASGEWGRLHYVTDPKQCTHSAGVLVSFADGGPGPIYVCVTSQARLLTLDHGRQKVSIPAGATWSASSPRHCNPQRQSRLVIDGDAPARFCAASQGGLLRRRDSCGSGEFEVVVPAHGHFASGRRGCRPPHGRPPITTTTTSTTATKSPTSTTTSTTTTSMSTETPNQAPELTLPNGQTLAENATLTFSKADANQISVADPDAGGGAEKVTLGVAHGTLELPLATGLASSSGDGTASVSIEGTIMALDEALEGIAYAPSTNFHGSDSLEVLADDLGHTGAGGAKTSTGKVALTVTTVTYDKALPDSYSVDEGQTLEVPAPGMLGNDTDSDSLPLEVKEVTVQPQHGTLTVQANGAFRYIPDPGFFGQDSFEYEDTDGNSASNPALVSIDVDEVDQAPVNTIPAAQSLAENSTLSFSSVGADGISVEDVDSDGGVERVTLSAVHGVLTPGSTASLASVSGSGSGTLVLEGTISALDEALEGLEYAPAHNYRGADTLTLETDDLGHTGVGGPLTTTSELLLTVTPVVYDTAVSDGYKVGEDDALIVSAPGVLANDTDTDTPSLPLSAKEVTMQPQHGTVTLNSNGSFTYTPDHLYTGTDSFKYVDDDGNTVSNEATVSIEVEAEAFDHANDDGYSTLEGQKLTVGAGQGVLVNDTDSEGLSLEAQLVSPTSHGTLSLAADGSFTYEPEAGYFGTDSFVYRDFDGNSHSNDATVDIDVAEVDHAPVNTVPAAQTLAENSTLIFSSLGANGISVQDVDSGGGVERATLSVEHGVLTPGSTASLAGVNGSGTGRLVLEGTISALDEALEGLTYVPEHNYQGADALTLETDDLGHTGVGGPLTSTSEIQITETPVVYDTAVPDSYKVGEDGTLEVSAPGVLSNDTDSDSPPLLLEAAELNAPPQHGTLQLAANGSFTYTPEHLYTGTDTFSYTDYDGNTLSNEATVTIEVEKRAFDTAVDDSYSVRENATLDISAPGVLANDTDSAGLALSAKLVTPPTDGSLTLDASGSFEYTPKANFSGTDSFTYKDDDGNTESNEATVTIAVEHVDQAPVNTVPGEQTTDSGTPLRFSSLGSNAISVQDADADGGVERVSLGAEHGTLVPGPTGNLAKSTGTGTKALVLEGTIAALNEALEGLAYTSESHYAGSDTLTIETDDLGHTGLEGPKTTGSTIAITVLHTNEPPTLSLPGSQEVAESTSTTPSSLVFSAAEKDAITVGDPDAEGGAERVSFSAEHGTLKLGHTTGLTSESGNESSAVAIEGTIATLNEALEGLEYRPTSDYSGAAQLAVEIDDEGNTGAGGAKTASGDVAITVQKPAPIPTNPTYDGAIGNTDLYVGVSKGTAPGVERSGAVISGEGPDKTTLSVVKEKIATTQGGSVEMSEDGTFTYTPPVGFENGSDTFHYTEKDSGGGEATGTATIKVDDARVWYVNDNSGTNGDGESGSPFNTLASVSGSSSKTGSGDVIFLYGSGSTYGGGLELKSSQTLDGQDEGLTVEGESLLSPSGTNPTITNSSGIGIDVAEGDTIKGVTVSGATGPGVAASDVNAFTLDSHVDIASSAGNGLQIVGGTSGTIADEAAIKATGAHSLVVLDRKGGNVSVSGAIEDTGTGISLSSNSGTSIAFSGRLTLSTGSHEAFSAVGGGTVTATNAESTATATTATALSVEETTIGAAGLKFQSISSGTASSGPSRGIVLVKTGSLGGLDVTGEGSAGSGGTVQHTTATDSATYGAGSGGVYLKETSDVTLTDMDVASNKANGIYGTAVSGLSITGASVTANGTSEATEDSGIRFDGLAGTASIASTTASGSPYDEAMITSEDSGTLTLALKHSTFGPKTAEQSDDGLEVEAIGTAAVSLTANEEDTFKEEYANGLETRDTSAGTMHVTVEHDAFQGNTGTGVDVSTESAGTVEFAVDDNSLTGQQGSGINLDANANSSGEMVGTVVGNDVGSAGTTDSGSKAGSGIALTSSGLETMTTDVAENKIVQIESENGINASADQGSSTLNLTLRKNEVHTDQTTSKDGVEVDSGAAKEDKSTVCLNATENTFVSSGTEAGNKSFNTFGLVLIQQGTETKFEIQGYTGAATNEAQIASYLKAQNVELKGTETGLYEGTALAEAEGAGFTDGTCPTVP